MQMPTALELLKLRLTTELGELVGQNRDVLLLRGKIRDYVNDHYPQHYSWVNRHQGEGVQVEVFSRQDGTEALLSIVFE